jgi:hypothetical protein
LAGFICNEANSDGQNRCSGIWWHTEQLGMDRTIT